MRNKIIGFVCSIMCAASMQAQDVQKVTIGDNQNFGITYTLPKTEVEVTVRAHSVKTVAGQYAAFAEKFLGINDAVTSDKTEWTLTSITCSTKAIADADRKFHILFPEKGTMPEFYLSAEGTLLSINRAPEQEAAAEEPAAEEEPAKKLALKPTDVLNEDILKASSKSKQAELIAREIFSIRESRRNLLKGDVDNMPADGASFQIIMDNFDAQETALLSLFVGTTTESDAEQTFTFVPTAAVNNDVLFRFSSHVGIVEKDDLVGEPYYYSVKINEDNRMEPAPVDPKKKPNAGIAYTVPGKATVSISYKGNVIAQAAALMGQFGHVEQLPASQFTDKKQPSSAVFSSLTGSIKLYE